jgi:hypothetical protein
VENRKSAGGAEFKQAWPALFIGFYALILAGQCHGQGTTDLQAIIRETQKSSQGPGQISLVWWLPEQFWQVSLGQRPTITKAQADQFLKIIRRYTTIAVLDGTTGPFGGVTYTSEEAIRTGVTIKDAKGESYAPLRESAVDPDMKNLLQILKPVITNMLGAMGQNMHFLVFQSKSKNGGPIADATAEGTLDVLLMGKEFKYRLPLASVLPLKYDPSTQESFPGNYNYNPFTGSKLVNQLAK